MKYLKCLKSVKSMNFVKSVKSVNFVKSIKINFVFLLLVFLVFSTACSKEDTNSYTVEIDEGSEDDWNTTAKITTSSEEKTTQQKNENDTVVLSETIQKTLTFIDDYYAAYGSKDLSTIISFIHPDLIEKVGGIDIATGKTGSRMYLIGKPTSYSIVSSGEMTKDNINAVVVETEVTYSTGQTTNEKFAITDVDGSLFIVDLGLDSEEYTDMFIDNHYSHVGDKSLYSKDLLPFMTDNSDIAVYDKIMSLMDQAGGTYLNHEVVQSMHTFDEYPDAGITLLYDADEVILNFENMSFKAKIEISAQEDQIGLNYTQLFPIPALDFYDTYFEMIVNDNIDGIMALYSDVFYQQINMTAEEWRPNMEYLAYEMPEITKYTPVEWDYKVQEMSDGSTMTILGLITYLTFEDGQVYQEQMIINYDDQTPMIQAYKIFPLDADTSANELDTDESQVNTVNILNLEPFAYYKGLYFYSPLTLEEAEQFNIEYDSFLESGDVKFTCFDWVEGDDGLEEDNLEDSISTVNSYANTLGLRIPTIDEMELYASSYGGSLTDYMNLPKIYWTQDLGGEHGTNPILFDIYYGPGEDFSPFDYPVILVSGTYYPPDYSNTILTEAIVNQHINFISDNGNNSNDIITLTLSDQVIVYDLTIAGTFTQVTLSSVIPSQRNYDLFLNEQGEVIYIHILPFIM